MVGTTQPNLGLTAGYGEGESGWSDSMNANLKMLDAVVNLCVLSSTTLSPPGSPADGDRYIVPAGATAAWAGKDNQVAVFSEGAWIYYTPVHGWVSYVKDSLSSMMWDDSGFWGFYPGSRADGEVVDLVADTDYYLSLDPQLASHRMLRFTDSGSVLTQQRLILLPNWSWARWRFQNACQQPLGFRLQSGGFSKILQPATNTTVAIMDGVITD